MENSIQDKGVEINSPFSLQINANKIGFVTIDVQSQTTNTLSVDFIGNLRELIGALLYQKVEAVIFTSAKTESFIQGFDLNSLVDKTESQLLAFSEQAQLVLKEIQALKIPTIAAIHGHCFGFGLEFALACDYRIASVNANTLFAMPQVRSGLLPFAGGTQLLPQRIGLKRSLPLLLSGQKINAQTAKSFGLIDELVPQNLLISTALSFLEKRNLVQQTLSKTAKYYKKLESYIETQPFARNCLLENAENKEWFGPTENYPAISTILAVLRHSQSQQGYLAEREGFAQLYQSNYSQVLRQLTHTQRQLKQEYLARSNVRDIKRLAIIGGGFIGAGIAYITASRAKIPVRIKDIHPAGIKKALQMSYYLFNREVAQGKLTLGEMQQRMYLISGGERFVGSPKADFIIEAVYEDLALKQQVLRDSEKFYSEQAIFATNTSTLMIQDIAKVATRPQQVIGFHYFSPISQRKMLEIIPHQTTSEQTIATAIHFALQQGKIPLLVSDKPGFFVNRILIPYLLEAIYCLVDGESVEFVDRALQEFGFKIGPLAMLDDFGLDLLAKMLPNLQQHYGVRFNAPLQLEYLISDERQGRKNRRGFYLYHSQTDERTMVDKSVYHTMQTIIENNLEAEQVARRCVLMMLNEAAWCLQDNVINDPNEGNMASVLGVFFPEFRGGIYAYMDYIGAKSIVKALNEHTKLYGERFTPCPWLIEQAERADKI